LATDVFVAAGETKLGTNPSGTCTKKATRQKVRPPLRPCCALRRQFGSLLTPNRTSIELQCTAHDFFSYNFQGPHKSTFAGERSHFQVRIGSPGVFSFQLSSHLEGPGAERAIRPIPAILVGPTGRVVFKGKLGKHRRWKATRSGTYSLKLWTGRIPDTFSLRVTGYNHATVEDLRQQIWSGASSNKDGSLFQAGIEVHRSDSRAKSDCISREDRRPQSFR
jgi:hypothetical protein